MVSVAVGVTASGASGAARTSNDAGATWYKAGAVLGDAPVLSLCAPAALPGVVLSGVAQAGVWISRDAGVTWARYGAGLGRLDVLSLLLEERVAPGVLYAGTSDGLWRLPMGQD